ncbi:formiminoglutamase [Methanolinea mesophila]|uniref:N-formylglutamate amidohydrolase n=1 Tax=Methanolinea mesophila TaxID=547055 RepID=UPI001AE53938|nr:N-formylglutamate amidohydrolase [Methanolinea mesophila]MBP1927462.1 formiminoglutamase [Methanolinea mesophila]
MMNKVYPFLLSVPHGGTAIPPGLGDRILLTGEEIRYYSDPASLELYDFRERVQGYLEASVSRVLVDLNRPPYYLPPRHTDGVVKTVTPDGIEIWKDRCVPDLPCIHRLLMTHYFPYHDRINILLDTLPVELAIDCHTMTPVGAPRNHDAGKKRPLVCIGNNGNSSGEPRPHALLTCPPGWARALARTFREIFPGPGDVLLNEPYPGGFIPNAHYWHKGVPWIQLELNRSLYEVPSGTHPGPAAVDGERVRNLHDTIWNVLSTFWDGLQQGPV